MQRAILSLLISFSLFTSASAQTGVRKDLPFQVVGTHLADHRPVYAADIDADGFDDICSIRYVFGGIDREQRLAIRWGGEIPFKEYVEFDLDGDVEAGQLLSVADFDGDEDLDLLIYLSDLFVVGALVNQGDRTFVFETVPIVPPGGHVTNLHLAPHADGRDGVVYAVTVNADDVVEAHFFERRETGWEPAHQLTLREERSHYLAKLAQYDLDAEPEFVITGHFLGTQALLVLDRRPDGTYQLIHNEQILGSIDQDFQLWVDLDNDGLDERITGTMGGIRVYDGATHALASEHDFTQLDHYRFHDFDLDGLPDLLTRSRDGLQLHRNVGGFNFEPTGSLATATYHSDGGLIIDIDNDGLSDFFEYYEGKLVANYAVVPFRYLASTRAQDSDLSSGSDYRHVACDVDLDGVDDLVVYSLRETDVNPVVFRWDDAAAEFEEIETPIFTPLAGSHFVLMDVDNDGDGEMVQIGPGQITTYYPVSPHAFFPRTSTLPQLEALSAGRPVVADYTHDGVLDIGISKYSEFTVYEGDGAGKFTVAVVFKLDILPPGATVAVPSASSDAYIDFYTHYFNNNAIVATRLHIGGSVSLLDSFDVDPDIRFARPHDYDRDGYVEAMYYQGQNLYVLEPAQGDNEMEPRLLLEMEYPGSTWVDIDLDDDGDLDTLITTHDGCTYIIDVFESADLNDYPGHVVSGQFGRPFDYDADGDHDFVSVSENRIVVLENQRVMPCRFDFNLDNAVDSFELAGILAAWGSGNPQGHDYDADGDVDARDLAVILANWGLCP